MRYLSILLVCLFVVGCGSSPIAYSTPGKNPDATTLSETSDVLNPQETIMPNLYFPKEIDSKLSRSIVYLDSIQINVMESYPLQFSLQMLGSLPTPCHQLRVNITPPDKDKRILIDVYSIVNPENMCVEMLEDFDVTIPLGSFPSGHYSIWVDGSQVSEFDS